MELVNLKDGLTVNLDRVAYIREENNWLTLHFAESWTLPISDPQDIAKIKQKFSLK